MIRVHDLTKTFEKKLTAVDQISFEVPAGEIFAFLGRNGAGKTTTIRILTTLLRPTNGSVMLDGIDPAKQRDEARRRFGVVFQESSLEQDLTVWDNMNLLGMMYKIPRKRRHERIKTLLTAFDLMDRKNDEVKKLSGGTRRRIEVARGFLHIPKILFLDEPTLGLDVQSRNQLWTHVREMNRTEGVTVFLTTHYMEEAAKMASTVCVINDGKIVTVGSPDQLKRQTERDSLEEAFLVLTDTAPVEGFSSINQRQG